MRLKRLEIAGFKSFPDRSELTFDSGVTAIVGPNGCGKSNVVDALTWVLGEQSAKSLRGDRMEDVIFGGSDVRRPTAAAEVRLKLTGVASRSPGNGHQGGHKSTGHGRRQAGKSNGYGHGHGNGQARGIGHGEVLSDEHLALGTHDLQTAAAGVALLDDDIPLIVRDVELMRRLYRSGESEYLIDGEICRLRDVQDLLMDAGVGVKGYAVIEQGKIGQILSARPTDRRQLIEEAAGVTKYKSRRRAAELKLEAAQQNLTRVDDIVVEVEKQRGALKRQAAKARRYRRLRDELRRWEKVQFAERYQTLGAAIESARARLFESREREQNATADLAALEHALEALRHDLVSAETGATQAREVAHARELTVGRLQQQIAFDQHQVDMLGTTAAEIQAEVASLDARREPARLEIDTRRAAAARSSVDRDEAAFGFAVEERTYGELQTRIEGLEGDVEAARSEVFAAVNAATALRHAMEHAVAARSRIGEQIAKLEVESSDLTIEAERAAHDRAAAEAGLQRARAAMEAVALARASRESELANARQTRESALQQFRAAEHNFAGLTARLRSLEELDAARAGFGDGARLVLAESNGDVNHMGSVVDYLDVDREHETAVEACLGDLLQHVVVRTHEGAMAGLRFASERNAGRVGFFVADRALNPLPEPGSASMPEGLTPLSQIVRVSGPAEPAIAAALSQAWLAASPETAQLTAGAVGGPVVTTDGHVYRGANVVEGGTPAEARGILATKREIKELRDRIETEKLAVDGLRSAISGLDLSVRDAEAAIASLQADLHREEKAVVGLELQLAAAAAAAARVWRKHEQIFIERRTAQEELSAQESRQDEARASIARIAVEQRAADERLNQAQRRLFEAREAMQAQARRTAEARATHAALMERATALGAEVERLEEAGRELETRAAHRRDELQRAEARRGQLREAIAAANAQLEAGLREFDQLRDQVRSAEDRCQSLRGAFDVQETRIKEARRAVEAIRADTARLDVARATAEADLTHLANDCVESVQATLDDVAAEIEQMRSSGELAPPRPVDDTPEPSESDSESPAAAETSPGSERPSAAETASTMTADEMVGDLRMKIDRMGPVNMMAIDQFDDLESRHVFLTTQRKDLVDAIAATSEAIKKIDKTTKERFNQAFTVINHNFERTFKTLFGGGRAGLVLLDETDALESGIDIIAQPPGKRLQNVQLLSGGEKALSAMALMFAIFQYRPSPFCLLDEIDAPLDDANIGRFVDMLQSMQDHTQFILITHNRKTMEIADRLYGVTMEEPGVSKLISVQLN